MDITPERLILLSTPDQYYLLGWGGIDSAWEKNEPGKFSHLPTPLMDC